MVLPPRCDPCASRDSSPVCQPSIRAAQAPGPKPAHRPSPGTRTPTPVKLPAPPQCSRRSPRCSPQSARSSPLVGSHPIRALRLRFLSLPPFLFRESVSILSVRGQLWSSKTPFQTFTNFNNQIQSIQNKGRPAGPHSPAEQLTSIAPLICFRRWTPLRVTSPRKPEAPRRNRRLYRGPKTPQGKARDCRNALKHGFRVAQHVSGPWTWIDEATRPTTLAPPEAEKTSPANEPITPFASTKPSPNPPLSPNRATLPASTTPTSPETEKTSPANEPITPSPSTKPHSCRAQAAVAAPPPGLHSPPRFTENRLRTPFHPGSAP
jgi:hypothetical protein